ncbi:MAG TPA: RNA polymerase sigma factor [Chitinophagaceae bacterium]|nr:RNA polymerase sigma factor [Chitinophagaceae bacterium]
MNESKELQLWKSFQLGDEKALADLYSIYFTTLYNYGFKFSRDAGFVEDCIQELFIKLIRNKKNLSLPVSVKTYLFKALRSVMFDKWEQAKKHISQELNETTDFDLAFQQESALVSSEDIAQQQRKLEAALQQLTPRQREAIFLKYQEGFSYPEIAEMLSLTQKATYKLIARAVQALRAATGPAILISAIGII